MKLLSFGKKKQQKPVMPSATERVLSLSSRGLSEPEIIQALREEGYTPVQVDKGMTEALRGAAAGPGVQPARQQRYAPGQGYAPGQREYLPPIRKPTRPYEEPPDDDLGDDEGLDYEESPPPGYPERKQQRGPPSLPQPPADFEDFKSSNKNLGFPEMPGRDEEMEPRSRAEPEDEFAEEEEEEPRPLQRVMSRDRTRKDIKHEKRRMIEELTEGVVEEKWQNFKSKVDDMNSMFQQLNQRISDIEQKLNQVQGEKKSDLMEIEDKIDAYKNSIDGIQSRMESVEKAMKDSLTPMMQTLRSLSDTIKSLKEKKG